MNIRQLQTGLNTLGYYLGTIDGQRGPLTIKATKNFQRYAGLVPDGVPGTMTTTALRRALTPPSKSARAEPDKSAMNEPLLSYPIDRLPKKSLVKPVKLALTARAVNTIILHCTATEATRKYTVADVRSWHKQRGFDDIGYHYLIDLDGSILDGRPVGQVGAHVEDHNVGSIGISYFGGISRDRPRDTRTDEQFANMLWLVTELSRMYPVKRIAGHSEYAQKACPCFYVPGDATGNIPGFVRGQRK